MKNPFLIFIVLCIGLYLLNLNFLYPDIMEARNFVSAREMVDDGNWIFTTLNGEARYQKPPLPTWLSAIMAEIFGAQSLGALRFPAALSCIILLVYFYKLVQAESKNTRLALISALVLATSFLVLYEGKRATWDIYAYSFSLIGIYYFYKTFQSEQKNFLYFSLAGLAFGFSILSKGPTGIYVLAIPFALGYWIAYGLPKIKWSGWIWMVFVGLAVGLSWYGYIYLHDRETLIGTLEIESTARTNRDVKPFTRYLSFAVQMGVWALFAMISLIYPYVKKRCEQPKVYTFFFWWTLISLILLSLIPSKKERYLFPMLIPLAATTGQYIYYLLKTTDLKTIEKRLAQFSFGLIGLIGLAIPALLFGFFKLPIETYSLIFSMLSAGCGIYLLSLQIRSWEIQKSFFTTIGLVSILMIIGTPVIHQLFNNNPNYHSILNAKQKIKESGLKLYGYYAYTPEVWYKYGENIPEIDFEANKNIPKEADFFLIISQDETLEDQLKRLENHAYQYQLIDRFDDNEEKSTSKNHVNRKVLGLYKVEKQL